MKTICNMKLFSILFFLVVSSGQLKAQWQWAVRAGDTQFDYGNSVVTDAGGNIYLVGSFADPAPSGNVAFGSLNVTGSTSDNAFIAKYNAAGTTCNWVTPFTSTGSAKALGISIDGSYAYVSGTYSGTLTLGSFTLTNASGGTFYKDAFLAKINCSNGQVMWAVKDGIGGLIHDEGSAVSAKAGSIFLSGYNGVFYFLTKYNSSGTLVWKTTSSAAAASSIPTLGESVMQDNSGNVYTYGTFRTFSGAYNFNSASGSGGATTSLTPNNGDIFIAKYNSNGAIQFIKQIGFTTLTDNADGMTLDNQNNIYITGNVGGAPVGTVSYFNGNGNSANSITTQGSGDMFVAKYNSAGTFQWLKTVASSGYESGYAITSDNLDNIYVLGECQFSNASIGCVNFINQNYTIIVAKYNSNGNSLWAEQKTMGGRPGTNNSITTDNNGNAIITGVFAGTGNSFGSTILNSIGGNDIFLAKISKPCANAGANGVICCGNIVIGTPALPGCTYSWTGSGVSPTNVAQPTCSAAGTFILACTTSTGCLSTDEVVVNYGPSCCPRLAGKPDDNSPSVHVSTEGIQIHSNNESNTIKEILLTDITGRVIFKKQYNDKIVRIDNIHYNPGIYFVSITFTDNSNFVEKVFLKN
ncbi:MAG: T9SS type A sorting domain-containing protein [Bacteroidia bacterium]|nr:T9SS type A sorting domain-containing protein [Bacteroidia bacterium]